MAIILRNGRGKIGIESDGAQSHIPGEVGIWVIIFGDLIIFAACFVAFLYDRSKQPIEFNAAQKLLTPGYGVINTLLLLTSSMLVVAGVKSVRDKMNSIAPRFFIGAALCGFAFVGMKLLEYSDKLSSGIGPNHDLFYMWFYVLTGLHFFHVILGLGFLMLLFQKARKSQLTSTELAVVEGGGCFWHMVDLLWIILFPLLYFLA